MAYWRPLDSAVAISAAMNASAGLPPADLQSSSRPEQLSVPLSPPDEPPLLPWLADCTTTALPPSVWPLERPELELLEFELVWTAAVTVTAAACFGS